MTDTNEPRSATDHAINVITSYGGYGHGENNVGKALGVLKKALAAQPSAGTQHQLTVWYGKMPESNGRENWTATLRRVNPTDKWDMGFCFAHSEYPGRVLYEADRMRWLIGERADRPDILAYDADTHSGYVEPAARERADMRQALDLALSYLGQFEPTDSRAVSDEYVAMAAAGSEHHNDEGRQIIRDALAKIEANPLPPIMAEVTFSNPDTGDVAALPDRDDLAMEEGARLDARWATGSWPRKPTEQDGEDAVDARIAAVKPETKWAGYCRLCGTARKVSPCHKCSVPLSPLMADHEEPDLPDIEQIRALAAEVGYAVGVHGSMERDLDVIAAPWVETAVSAPELAAHLAKGLNARLLNDKVQDKPCGRWSCCIQIDGWFKHIDLSVCATTPAQPYTQGEAQ